MNEIKKIHHIALNPLDCNIDHEEGDTLTVQRVKALAYLVRSHGQQLADMERNLEEARKDAERYRWLREHSRDPGDELPYCVMQVYTPQQEQHLVFDEALDKAIDAARTGKDE